MRWRKVSVKIIVTELIKATKGGIVVNRDELEALSLAGGNVTNVVDGLIYANSKDIELSFKEASKIDLQRRDLIKYINEIK